MSRIQELFDQYSESHQNPINKAIHWICVPAIVFSLFAMLWQLPQPFARLAVGLPPEAAAFLNWASLVYFLVQLFYLRLSPAIFLAMLPVGAAVLGGCATLSAAGVNLAWVGGVIFVTAWIGQFIGHHIEGKRPSFLQDLRFLLIGPAWLLGFLFRAAGIRY